MDRINKGRMNRAKSEERKINNFFSKNTVEHHEEKIEIRDQKYWENLLRKTTNKLRWARTEKSRRSLRGIIFDCQEVLAEYNEKEKS